MTTINATSTNTTSAATAASTAVNSASKLGIKDFLTLMTSQLKYQDPTEPQKSSEFVAQLAQFSSVSGIQEMNTSMTSLLSEWRGGQAVNATSLMGRNVLLTADSTATSAAGQSVTGAVQTPTGASNIQLVVTDSSGQIVRQQSLATQTPLSQFTWDGLDNAGAAAPAGKYTFTAIANVAGQSQSATTLLQDKITSVTISPTDNSLTLNTAGLGTKTMADVRQIM